MLSLLSSVIAMVFAVTVHEYSHAWMANRLGDPTGRIQGRLSLNPLRHFDLFGTLSLIFVGIGWGKPVPFNPDNLRFPKRDSALIAIAGPISNFITALICAIPLKYLGQTAFSTLPLYGLLQSLFWMSVLLFSLNVLPLPPFDGSKVIGIFIPHHFERQYDHYLREGVKYVILFILFDMLVIEKMAGFSLLRFVVFKLASWIITFISLGT